MRIKLLGDAISIEKFLTPPIASASSSDKYLLFPHPCKYLLSQQHLNWHLHERQSIIYWWRCWKWQFKKI